MNTGTNANCPSNGDGTVAEPCTPAPTTVPSPDTNPDPEHCTYQGKSPSGGISVTVTGSSHIIVTSDGSIWSCDVPTQGDPLMIDMSGTSGNIWLQLSTLADGILFDILGQNSAPFAHAKRQVAWTKTAQYMFIALPDQSGNVSGIDQLFGNNTRGPDGSFASDGFAALAKYDANHDGVIDMRDPVFKQLRLWSDGNFDGVAQKSELHGLVELGISSIDLHYDPSFIESDTNGNTARYKSVAKTSGGDMRLVFDLWMMLR